MQGWGWGIFHKHGSRLWRQTVLCWVHGWGDPSRKGGLKPLLLLKLCNHMNVILLRDLEKEDWNYFLTFGYNPSSLNILYSLSFCSLVFQNVKSSQKGFQVNGYRRGWHRNKRGEISHSNFKLKVSHSYFITTKTYPSKNYQSKF